MAQSTKEEIALERMKHKLAINILKIEPIQDIFNRIGVELGEYYNWSDSTTKNE